MIDAFKIGVDFHSRTAALMYHYIRKDIHENKVVLDGNNCNHKNIQLVKDKYK